TVTERHRRRSKEIGFAWDARRGSPDARRKKIESKLELGLTASRPRLAQDDRHPLLPAGRRRPLLPGSARAWLAGILALLDGRAAGHKRAPSILATRVGHI